MSNPYFRSIVYLATLVTSALAAAPPPVAFNSPRIYLSGDTPQSLAMGDFNGDGIPDAAVTIYALFGSQNCTVAVMLGNRDGTFQPAVDYSVGNGCVAVAVADFNNDGKLDIAVALYNYYTSLRPGVSLLFGNGDGTFQPATPTSDTGYGPRFIAVGDFNGDGIADLAVANSEDNTISVLLGNGDGAFQPQVTYSTGTYPVEIAVSDLTGDGRQDLVVASYGYNGANGSILVLLGNGDGSFSQGANYPATQGPWSIAVGDFNEDAIPDLAVAVSQTGHPRPGTVAIMLGKGDGSFERPVDYTVGKNPVWIVASDLNRDGHLDLVVADYGSGDNTILLGNGHGAFRTAGRYAPGGKFVAVADFNRDGSPDLVTSDGPDISVLLGDGRGAFQSVTTYSAGKYPVSISAADFNADGNLDLVVANPSVGTISLLLGNANGTFQPAQTINTGSSPYSVAVGDFNNDGKLDIAVAASMLQIFLGNGDGTFRPPISYPGLTLSLAVVDVADFNGDGNADLAVASQGTIYILLGNGNATFQPPLTNSIYTGEGKMAIGDFNGDGKPDIAVSAGAGFMASIGILLGNGDGTFQPPQYYTIGSDLGAVAVGDFNGDGKLDIAASALYDSFSAAILLGNGDGTFQAPVTYPGNGLGGVAVADFNGDGRLDVAVTSRSCVSILLGNGDGTFRQPVNFAASETPNSLAAGDFHHDGKPDLAVANYLDISVLLNTSRK